MTTNKMSAQLLQELPPVLAQFIEQERNPWLESVPKIGKAWLRERQVVIEDLSDLGVLRRLLLEFMGADRCRGLFFRIGFERGRAQAILHMADFNRNIRLALQAGHVLPQTQGKFTAALVRFEFDLDERTLYRELLVKDCFEALVHQMVIAENTACVCWETAGYLSGHTTEILGRRALTLETECLAKGDGQCRFITRFDAEWGEEAAWIRQALTADSVDAELLQRDETAAASRKAELRARTALSDIQRRLRSDLMLESLVGECATMKPVMHRAHQVMACDAPVLLLGEAGTGKETLARAIHFGGARRSKPFIGVDCMALQPQLLAQELFGFVQDGVQGAAKAYVGACQRAHGGTLYLNELANLTLEAQIMLLRILREGFFFPFGAEEAVKCDLRVLAGSENDLAELASSGAVLQHLYYALSVVTIELPPLRQRDNDILRMAEAFAREFGERYNRPDVALSKDFKCALIECTWPGNIRQLRNVIEHAIIMSESGTLGLGELPDDVLTARQRRPEEPMTREVVEAALRRAKGSRGRAAEILGISRTSLWRCMKQFSIRG